jgi:signal transduction histidine kinase
MDDRFQLLGRLAAGVVHDLSNYLWLVDLSLLKMEQRDGLGEELRPARDATQRALQLSACLLAYARGSAPIPCAVDLAEMARQVLELFEPTIPERIKVVLRTPEFTAPIWGIAPELEQLLLNLILNACDAMPDGGTLEVAVDAAGSSLSLEVSDTGRGLPSAANGTSTKGNGGGLGLGIVHRVVERHGATLDIKMRARGGTSFVVSFPCGIRP